MLHDTIADIDPAAAGNLPLITERHRIAAVATAFLGLIREAVLKRSSRPNASNASDEGLVA